MVVMLVVMYMLCVFEDGVISDLDEVMESLW